MIKLVTNRLILSVLCIIIGMVPLIAFVNTMQSGKQMLKSEFGDNTLMLLSVDLEGSTALYGDFEKLSKAMPEISDIITISTNSAFLESYKDKSAVSLKAVNSSFLKYAGLKITRGSFFNKDHIGNNPNVIVIDDLTADQLFGTTEVLGQTIKTSIDGKEFEATIIGVSKRLDISEKQLNREQGFAYVPITMLDNNLTQYDMQKVLLLVKGIQVDEAKAKIIHFFKDNDINLDYDNIKLTNQVELISAFAAENNALFAIMALLWFALAIVGLTNIMLVDIEQSKKYYGLLKFYGRSEVWIRKLVYIKAYIIALACGGSSIIFGIAASFVICYILNISLYVSIHSISIGLLVPMLICLVSSIYPAYRASSIDINNTIWQLD
jgi:putative ABC transport system permease protein